MKYLDGATAWRREGEGFERVVLPCVWQGVQGANPGNVGDSNARSTLVLLPPEAVPLKRGDYVSEGIVEGETPASDAYAVTTVEAVRVRGALHHWEVTAT